jgi:threonine dehydrogenase-like Zn-dependent dehydrogenase
VLGCGSIGLLCLIAARHQGLRELVAVDVAAERREAAVRAGATAVSKDIPELPFDEGPWAFIDCTGNANVASQTVQAAPPQSRITLVGVTPGEIQLPLKEVLDKELELVGSLSHDAGDFAAAIELLADSSFDSAWLITRRITLEELPSLLADLADDQEPDELKVLVAPTKRHT